MENKDEEMFMGKPWWRIDELNEKWKDEFQLEERLREKDYREKYEGEWE